VIALAIETAVSTTIAMVIFLSADYLGIGFFKNSEASALLVPLLIFFVFHIYFYFMKFVFEGFQNMKLFSAVEFIYIVFVSASTFAVFTVTDPSAIGASYGYAIGAFAAAIAAFLMFFKVFPGFLRTKLLLEKDMTKTMLSFSIPLMFYGIATVIMIYTDTLCITYFRSMEDVGLYQIAVPIAQVMMYFAMALDAVLYPLISELWFRKKFTMVSKGISLALKLYFIIIIPAGLIFITFPEIVINVLFGPGYLGAVNTLRILSVGMILFNLGMLFLTTLNGIGKPAVNAKIVSLAAICNLAANLALVPPYGASGAAISTAVSFSIYFFLGKKFLKSELAKGGVALMLPIRAMIKIFLGGCLTLGIIFILKSLIVLEVWLKMLAVLAPSFVFYAFWLLYTKCISKDDMKIIKMLQFPLSGAVMAKIEKIIR
jgi:O-antigen/teichoic acid export membrane protein